MYPRNLQKAVFTLNSFDDHVHVETCTGQYLYFMKIDKCCMISID